MEREDRGRGERLKRFILSQIESRGAVPFAQFMDWCLYHPQFGYYQTEGIKIGKEGDYYLNFASK
jgi:SAM-dependent MidA family methyltransferase